MKERESIWTTPAMLLALFVVGALASIAASIFVSGLVPVTMKAPSQTLGLVTMSVTCCAALLLLSRTLLHREGMTIRALGLVPSRQRFRELVAGFSVTTPFFLLVAVAQSASVGAAWEFQGAFGARAALAGLALSAVLVLVEELLFRGVALRYLRALYGDRGAVILSALLFGAYHLLQSGDWAMGAVFRFLMPTLGGLVFGWAAVRSKGLALPLGLHLGGNWVQASLASYVPVALSSSAAPIQSLWRIPITTADAFSLTAPDLLPHLPYLIALALTTVAIQVSLRLNPTAHVERTSS